MANAAEVVALSKLASLLESEGAREALGKEGGKFPVNVTVHLSGTLSVEVDTDKYATVSLPTLETLALTLKYSGITGAAAKKAILAAMKDALALGPEGKGAILKAYPEIAESLAEVKAMVKLLPKTPVKGAVSMKGITYEILSGN
jgi:hypothetical protein